MIVVVTAMVVMGILLMVITLGMSCGGAGWPWPGRHGLLQWVAESFSVRFWVTVLKDLSHK